MQTNLQQQQRNNFQMRPSKRLFLVDNHWRVIAESAYCAKKTMGRYFDLPIEWWEKLKVECIGLAGQIQLNGKEIVQDF